MTIRTRLTLWYSGMLLVSLLLMSGVLYYELIFERRPAVPVEQQEEPPRQITEILFLYGAPTLAMLLVGGWFLMRRTLAPVEAITAAAELVHSGNLRERLPRSGNGDELDHLTGVLNAMLVRLDESFQRIREFTLHASHELKTPLTIMRGEVEGLIALPSATPAQRELLAGHLEEIQRLAQIVDNLTLLTKADAGLVRLAQEDVPLHELVREAFDDAGVLGAPLALEVELIECETAHVRGDRDRLRQVLLNLVDNAVKYNEPGGSITIRLHCAGPKARVTVSNTGPGIAPEELPRVFDRFHRGNAARRLHAGGCGLGLNIAQWIVAAHRGSLVIDSQPAGRTTTTVSLPCGGAPDPDASVVRTENNSAAHKMTSACSRL